MDSILTKNNYQVFNNPLGLAWWIGLGPGSVILLQVSSSILSGVNLLGGLI